MTDMEAPPDPELLGVHLSVYAAVLGYLCEGLTLEQGLDHVAIPLEEWPVVHAAWSASLAESALGDGLLVEACDHHRFAAAAHVERRLPPLDVDQRAWLDFYRAFTVAEDPLSCVAVGTGRAMEDPVYRGVLMTA